MLVDSSLHFPNKKIGLEIVSSKFKSTALYKVQPKLGDRASLMSFQKKKSYVFPIDIDVFYIIKYYLPVTYILKILFKRKCVFMTISYR